MKQCRTCDKETRRPFSCNYCNALHCSDHRLPEKHDCPGIDVVSTGKRFKSSFQAIKDGNHEDSQARDRQRRLESGAIEQGTRIDTNTPENDSLCSDEDESDELPPPSECPDCASEDGFKYSCNYCGEVFCPRHRLPEIHDCPEENRYQHRSSSTPPKPSWDSPSRGLDAETYETIEPDVTPGRTPDPEEIIDDTSPDVALDGSIADEETEPLEGEGGEQPRWTAQRVAIGLLLLILIVGSIVFAALGP